MYQCSLAIGHKHYTSWKWWFGRNQWLTCMRCKAITSLLFSGVGVWSKSGFKGLFSKLKRINMQHWPCCQSSMTAHALKTTGNTELGNLRLQWVQNNWELWQKWALTGKIRFEQSSNSELQVGNSELWTEDHWHHDWTLFYSEFPVVLKDP